MITLDKLTEYTDRLLDIADIHDYCPNGLQVEGRPRIKHLVAGVTACQALLDAAIYKKADAILVHHGYFWKSEPATITGLRKTRLQTLLRHDVGLLAYHLPLDCHPLYGNNVQLAKILDIIPDTAKNAKNRTSLVLTGCPDRPQSAEDFAQHLQQRLGRQPLVIPGKSGTIRRIAWCTGAAQSFIDQAVDEGVDAYLTGEVSEQTVHTAREAGIHFFAAGHHATERYGVQALGRHLAEQFDLQFSFIDIDNPV